MDVLMPQLGETVAEGRITHWYKSAGDKVQPGENLFEIETDKTSMEVPATGAGILAEIRAAVGDVVPVGAVVAVIADTTGNARAAATPASSPQPASAQPPTPALGVADAKAPRPPVAAVTQLDPFLEVRTPTRNYGPARRGSVTITPGMTLYSAL